MNPTFRKAYKGAGDIKNSISQFQKQTSNNTPEGVIVDWPHKNMVMGGSGSLGIIGGAASGGIKAGISLWKTFTNAVKQYIKKPVKTTAFNPHQIKKMNLKYPKPTELLPQGRGYSTSQINYNPGPVHASRSLDLGLNKTIPTKTIYNKVLKHATTEGRTLSKIK